MKRKAPEDRDFREALRRYEEGSEEVSSPPPPPRVPKPPSPVPVPRPPVPDSFAALQQARKIAFDAYEEAFDKVLQHPDFVRVTLPPCMTRRFVDTGRLSNVNVSYDLGTADEPRMQHVWVTFQLDGVKHKYSAWYNTRESEWDHDLNSSECRGMIWETSDTELERILESETESEVIAVAFIHCEQFG
jgi:hypothetical protein